MFVDAMNLETNQMGKIEIPDDIVDKVAEEIQNQNITEEIEASLVESAREKLISLGLDEEEAKIILGQAPISAE